MKTVTLETYQRYCQRYRVWCAASSLARRANETGTMTRYIACLQRAGMSAEGGRLVLTALCWGRAHPDLAAIVPPDRHRSGGVRPFTADPLPPDDPLVVETRAAEAAEATPAGTEAAEGADGSGLPRKTLLDYRSFWNRYRAWGAAHGWSGRLGETAVMDRYIKGLQEKGMGEVRAGTARRALRWCLAHPGLAAAPAPEPPPVTTAPEAPVEITDCAPVLPAAPSPSPLDRLHRALEEWFCERVAERQCLAQAVAAAQARYCTASEAHVLGEILSRMRAALARGDTALPPQQRPDETSEAGQRARDLLDAVLCLPELQGIRQRFAGGASC
jgi:hypothetical protein